MNDKAMDALANWRGEVHFGAATNEADELQRYRATGLTPEEITNLHYDHQEFRRYVAENAHLRAERDKAVEDIALLVASSPTIKCSLVCNGDCLDCVTSASGMPRGYKWRGMEGKA